MGTITEVSLVWNKLMMSVIEPHPLVLLGECWKPVIKCWQENLLVSDADVSLLDFAETAEQACEIILAKSPKTI
jgi:predicted Rossmann-fold nucleotide-binding protein